MADLVDRLALAFAHIEPVRAIDHHTVHVANILVTVYDTLRDNYRFRTSAPTNNDIVRL